MSIEAKVSLTGRKLNSSLNILEDWERIAMPSPAATRATTPAEVLAVAAISGAKFASAQRLITTLKRAEEYL
ncbi:MAG TPA: hypothetical protein VHZ55_33020, partial [Bryobacteraceae bacterium]|nr:hypothetical protein [Bryobacteraceae bacterium]